MGTKVKKEKYPDGRVKSILTYDGEILNGPAKNYFENGKLKTEYEFVNGYKQGETIWYFENGNIQQIENYVDDLLQGEMKQYYESGNILVVSNWIDGVQQGLVTKYYEDGKKNRESTIIDGFFDGDQTEWWNNGKIKAKRFYKKDIIINLTEWDEDGELIKESISEILVQKLVEKGHYVDNLIGSELSLKEWKDGNLIKEELQYEYEKPSNIKGLDESFNSNTETNDKSCGEDLWWNWQREKHKKYSSIKTYYDNGKLRTQSQFWTDPKCFRHAPNQYEVPKYLQGPFKEYFPSGNVMCEGNYKSEQKDGLWIFYFETGKLKSEKIFNNDICESLKEWDEDGKLIQEKLLKNGDSRTVLMHEVMSKGGFHLELKDGTDLNVWGQRHILVEIEEFYEDGEWLPDGDRDYIDEFHLTGYEEGYRYDEGDLQEFFDLAEDSYPEYNWNGFGDWEETEEEWYAWKSKFPTVKSKEQFRID